jgi:hypothetical protein
MPRRQLLNNSFLLSVISTVSGLAVLGLFRSTNSGIANMAAAILIVGGLFGIFIFLLIYVNQNFKQ